MDLQAARERRLGRLDRLRAAGQHPPPAEAVDQQAGLDVAAVGVDDVACAAVDLGRLERRLAALLPQQRAQPRVVEGRERLGQVPAHGRADRVHDHLLEGLLDRALQAEVDQPRGGCAARRRLALPDLVAVEHQDPRARGAQLARDREPGERGPADHDVVSGSENRRECARSRASWHGPAWGEALQYLAAHGSHDDTARNHRRRKDRRGLQRDAPRDRRADPAQLRRDDRPLRGGRRGDRQGRPDRQGRGPYRHRLQERGGHPQQRALDPQVRRPLRRGRDGRGGRRAGPHQGGPGRPADPVQEARPLRARLAPDRGRRRVRRAGDRRGHRGRQGRPDHRPRGARLPARLAGRHPPRAEPGRVPRPEHPVQGHRAQPLAQQRGASAAARCWRRSARSSARRSWSACSRA